MLYNSNCFPQHKPVLLNQLLSLMAPKEGDIVFDCTLGLGGHAALFLKKIGEKGTYIATDLDNKAILYAKDNLSKVKNGGKLLVFHDNYLNIGNIVKKLEINALDLIICDLGISSYQIDSDERGFSFKLEGPLDMRMDEEQDKKASDIVNTYTTDRLVDIFLKYGELPRSIAIRVALGIVEYRNLKPIEKTIEFTSLIESKRPGFYKQNKYYSQIYQALRIEVNDELKNLSVFLDQIFDVTKKGSKIGFITFHSLEDRLVKNYFKKFSKDCLCEKYVPICDCKNKYPNRFKLLTPKGIVPTPEELQDNPRSRSAKLRVVTVI